MTSTMTHSTTSGTDGGKNSETASAPEGSSEKVHR